MITSIRHFALVVHDLGKAIDFYQGLGFRVVSRQKEEWEGEFLEICKMRGPPGIDWPLLELIQGNWFPHISVTVDSLDEHCWGSVVHDRPGCRVCFKPDGVGNFIEMVEEG